MNLYINAIPPTPNLTILFSSTFHHVTMQYQEHVQMLDSVGAAEGMAMAATSLPAIVGVTHPATTTTTAAQISPLWDVNVRD